MSNQETELLLRGRPHTNDQTIPISLEHASKVGTLRADPSTLNRNYSIQQLLSYGISDLYYDSWLMDRDVIHHKAPPDKFTCYFGCLDMRFIFEDEVVYTPDKVKDESTLSKRTGLFGFTDMVNSYPYVDFIRGKTNVTEPFKFNKYDVDGDIIFPVGSELYNQYKIFMGVPWVNLRLLVNDRQSDYTKIVGYKCTNVLDLPTTVVINLDDPAINASASQIVDPKFMIGNNPRYLKLFSRYAMVYERIELPFEKSELLDPVTINTFNTRVDVDYVRKLPDIQ